MQQPVYFRTMRQQLDTEDATTPHAYKEWPHTPSHLFVPRAAYIVTAATLNKEHYFRSPHQRSMLLSTLFKKAEEFSWRLEAWAVMSNHYHFVAHAPNDAKSLPAMLKAVHSITAIAANRDDGSPGRRVWYRYWETCLTLERSYLARLNYVHNNPVKHGLVPSAECYPWCSMGWFTQQADAQFRKTVSSFKYDSISIDDDY